MSKCPGSPEVNFAVVGLEKAGGERTIRVKAWLVPVPGPLLAVMVRSNSPLVEGVPAMVAVPSPLSVKLTPEGRLPVLVSVSALGLVVTVKVPAVPLTKVVWSALVIVDGLFTLSAKDC